MGRFWKNDDEVYAWGDTVAARLAGLANKEGIAYGAEAGAAMRTMLHENARDFLSLDPQKILDEWDRMAKASKDVCVDISEVVTVELGAAKDHLAGWHGEGADLFKRQVDNIRAFTGSQYEAMVETVRALAGMLRVAVQSREDFATLAQAVMHQVDKVFEDEQEKNTEFVLKVGNGVVKTVIGVLSDPKKALFAVAENIMDIGLETVTRAMDGGKLGDIVTSYVRERDHLLRGYESELNEVAGLLERTQAEYQSRTPLILIPLPVTINVRGPDFRYEAFMSKDRDPAGFGAEVERERQKYVAEQQPRLVNPDSPIQQRLGGGR
jgi:hypothetical protein